MHLYLDLHLHLGVNKEKSNIFYMNHGAGLYLSGSYLNQRAIRFQSTFIGINFFNKIYLRINAKNISSHNLNIV